jgi:hypothetical protein
MGKESRLVMYKELTGKWGYQATTAGTLTIAATSRVLQIMAIGGAGGGTIAIWGGSNITIPASQTVVLRFLHELCVPTPSSSAIVATGTVSAFVETVG